VAVASLTKGRADLVHDFFLNHLTSRLELKKRCGSTPPQREEGTLRHPLPIGERLT
jgi:hypothetical protein